MYSIQFTLFCTVKIPFFSPSNHNFFGKKTDQYQYLSNCTPAPQQSTDNKLGLKQEGEGEREGVGTQMRKCSDNDIDPRTHQGRELNHSAGCNKS